jgi:hypothetical protein
MPNPSTPISPTTSNTTPVISPEDFSALGNSPVDNAVQDLLGGGVPAPADPPSPPPPPSALQQAADYVSDAAASAGQSVKQGAADFYNAISNNFSYAPQDVSENDNAPSAYQNFNASSSGGPTDPIFNAAGDANDNANQSDISKETVNNVLPVLNGAGNQTMHVLNDMQNSVQNQGPPPQINSPTDFINLGNMPIVQKAQGVMNWMDNQIQSTKTAIKNFFNNSNSNNSDDVFNAP